MAFYGSSYAGSGFGEYDYNSYAMNYDSVQNPGFIAYNYQESNQPYYGYDSSLYYDPAPTYSALSYPAISYSAATSSEPKFIEYDPNYGNSQLVIHYSNLEFNEPEFEEYDPTPYGGGYNIVETYGKPRPPSDQTCYPRSGSLGSKGLPSGPIVLLPAVEKGTDEKAIVPQNESAGQVTDEMPQPQLSLTDFNSSGGEDIYGHETEEEDGGGGGGDDDSGSGDGGGYGNGYSGGHYDEYEKPVPVQYPYGYGMETLDLCESVFGYWPCLARMKKERENCGEGDYCYRENMWKGTADYLFGSTNPYGRGEEGSSHGGGDLVYAYQRHYPTQAEYRQVA
ncbi:hypothetical protein K1719_008622 [Acacia pycnantha]|nr:hypothetical protein K1719_008622 [Acacia pycnantha]